MPMAPDCGLADKLGVCQWFHYEDHEGLERAIDLMAELGLRHLRTGISWADWHRPGATRWFDRQIERLTAAGLEILLSVWHTPPSLSENGRCSGPPRRLQDYADFIDILITRYGGAFQALELWNEPNNQLKWNFVDCDPQWSKFAEMIGMAAHWARRCGTRTVLGGMSPADPDWLELMRDRGVLAHIDVVAIHGFPQMWGEGKINWEQRDRWHGWPDKIAPLAAIAAPRPIWITETGLATWNRARARIGRHRLQQRMLATAARAPAERVYWYSLIDLAPERPAIEQTEGDWQDPYEYHMGLVTHDGRRKPAFAQFQALLAEIATADRG